MESLCLTPRNLSKSKGPSTRQYLPCQLVSLISYSVAARKNYATFHKLDHFSKVCLSQFTREYVRYPGYLELLKL